MSSLTFPPVFLVAKHLLHLELFFFPPEYLDSNQLNISRLLFSGLPNLESLILHIVDPKASFLDPGEMILTNSRLKKLTINGHFQLSLDRLATLPKLEVVCLSDTLPPPCDVPFFTLPSCSGFSLPPCRPFVALKSLIIRGVWFDSEQFRRWLNASNLICPKLSRLEVKPCQESVQACGTDLHSQSKRMWKKSSNIHLQEQMWNVEM